MSKWYSCQEKVSTKIPQGSILGLLLFDIHLCDLLFMLCTYDIVTYTNDNTSYVTGKTVQSVITTLEKVSDVNFEWVNVNQMQAEVMV